MPKGGNEIVGRVNAIPIGCRGNSYARTQTPMKDRICFSLSAFQDPLWRLPVASQKNIWKIDVWIYNDGHGQSSKGNDAI